jgi:hypothetical protein
MGGPTMTESLWVRIMNRDIAIYAGARGNDKVGVMVDGREQVIAKSEWEALPIYTGPAPLRNGSEV